MNDLRTYRDPAAAARLVDAIRSMASQRWALMEICGGQTHAILRYGIDELLADAVELIHGPGCPVCVTPIDRLDAALAIAARPEVIFCSFGDMLRVPGSSGDLFSAKARGADVRIVYSPMDALKLAAAHPDRQVVFFGVGFETTAPATAMTLFQADQLAIDNFSMLISHVLVPPAMETILGSPQCRVQGFLAAGHVCTVMGYHEYAPIAEKYRVPIVVTGFEPLDILQGIHMCIRQLEAGTWLLENQYRRIVHREGNRAAQDLLQHVFTISPQRWRGLGEIDDSGLSLKAPYDRFDAVRRFSVDRTVTSMDSECMAGAILQGIKKPHQCPAFGGRCTPESPLGAPMVSNEGACAAYYRYQRHHPQATDSLSSEEH